MGCIVLGDLCCCGFGDDFFEGYCRRLDCVCYWDVVDGVVANGEDGDFFVFVWLGVFADGVLYVVVLKDFVLVCEVD